MVWIVNKRYMAKLNVLLRQHRDVESEAGCKPRFKAQRDIDQRRLHISMIASKELFPIHQSVGGRRKRKAAEHLSFLTGSPATMRIQMQKRNQHPLIVEKHL